MSGSVPRALHGRIAPLMLYAWLLIEYRHLAVALFHSLVEQDALLRRMLRGPRSASGFEALR